MNKLKFSNGDEIDAIGLGTWKSDKAEIYQAVRDAIKLVTDTLIVLGFTLMKPK